MRRRAAGRGCSTGQAALWGNLSLFCGSGPHPVRIACPARGGSWSAAGRVSGAGARIASGDRRRAIISAHEYAERSAEFQPDRATRSRGPVRAPAPLPEAEAPNARARSLVLEPPVRGRMTGVLTTNPACPNPEAPSGARGQGGGVFVRQHPSCLQPVRHQPAHPCSEGREEYGIVQQ